MNAEIGRLFEAALELPADQRENYLLENCGDADLRREVEILLEHDSGAETFLAQAVGEGAASVMQEFAFARGQRIGPCH